jgi:nicotinamidase/pyrazinamidase
MAAGFVIDRRHFIAGATVLTGAAATRPLQAQEKPMIDAATALIVVDVQNDFCPGGNLAVTKGDEVVAVINALGKRFSSIVLTQDWHPAGHSSFATSHPGKKPFELIQMPYGPQLDGAGRREGGAGDAGRRGSLPRHRPQWLAGQGLGGHGRARCEAGEGRRFARLIRPPR